MRRLQFDENQIQKAIEAVVKRTFQMDFNWDWPGGIALYGVGEAYKATGRQDYLDMLIHWVDEQLEDGLPKLSVNGASIGHTLLTIYESTGNEDYLKSVLEMANFLLEEAERFGDGVLQHTVNSTDYVFHAQAWVDTMMMAGLYLLRVGKATGNTDYYQDGLHQFHTHEILLQDNKTDLYYHGWDDETKNHMSGVFWARGNGWAALTMARALELIDVTHPSYMVIDGSLRDQLSSLARRQSEEGLWHTIVDDPGSYQEVSGSAAISSALLSRGKLYDRHVGKALSAILARIDDDGRVHDVSAGTAVMKDREGYRQVPYKRIQGWGQGLVLAFLADILRTQNRVFD
ncbi:glycoside hydrolase family 88/105 protein [Gracilibacillus sp. Marseille-QA3620]